MSKTAKELADKLAKAFTVLRTGSRRFGFYNQYSDYDFAADYTHKKDWHNWLKGEGFYRIGGEYIKSTKCTDTAEVWEKEFVDSKIQIVLSRNFANKKRIFEWLDKRPEIVANYYQVPKHERHAIWERLHQLAKEGKI